MPAPIIPWQPCNIPEEIQSEFNRRKINRSLRYIDTSKGEWDSANGDWSKYRGPMSPWVRLCSNSRGPKYQTDRNGNTLINSKGTPVLLDSSRRKEGFILYGGKGFYSDYGFTKSDGNPSIIGYVPNKEHDVHTIDNDLNADYPIHVPAPEIERIQITIQKELYRRASVEWVCFSRKQLEYMTPYFLIPGISCIMEWGWNLYNPISLVDLTNPRQLESIFNNPYSLYTKNIMSSRGNYDVIFGIITNFEWEADGNKFRCKTEITSKDRIYAGLIVDATATDQQSVNETKDTSVSPLNSLVQFIDKSLDQFRGVVDQDPKNIPDLADFTAYVRDVHKIKGNANEYLYGVFSGRGLQKKSPPNKLSSTLGFSPSTPQSSAATSPTSPNVSEDFDIGEKNVLWLNLGLIIEAINFHARPAKGMSGKEMLRIDIDDVVIGAHPNMISSDGSVCLIPNFESPKYFYGEFGYNTVETAFGEKAKDQYKESLHVATSNTLQPPNKSEAKKQNRLADFRLYTVCYQLDGVSRDDIDLLINKVRYSNGVSVGSCSFPFKYPVPAPKNGTSYPPHYTGYLRNIYVGLPFLKGLIDNSSDIKTYYQLVERILEEVNSACGGFWDLRLVSGAGDAVISPDDPAPMKIVDYKFMYFSNRGTVWSFDYMDADSLLLGIGFKPTLSNAQAIRTIYAQTNNPDNITTITNGNNELLDYKYKDRLNLGKNVGNAPTQRADRSGFEETMRALQQPFPCKGSFQMTIGNHVYRLALPATDIQQLLLDDDDQDNNPKYTGIMPGIQATFTIQGIGGLRTFMMFLCRGLPEPYSEKSIVFRIVDVQETVEAGKWTTQITAGVIPLRAYIKARLGIKT